MACNRGFLLNKFRSEDDGGASLRGLNEALKCYDDDDAGKPPSLFPETKTSSESFAEPFLDDGAEFPASSSSAFDDINGALNDANDKGNPCSSSITSINFGGGGGD